MDMKQTIKQWVKWSVPMATLLLSGCSFSNVDYPYVSIPWEWFQTEEDKQTLENVHVRDPIPAVDFSQEEMVMDVLDLEGLQEFLTHPDTYVEGVVNREGFTRALQEFVTPTDVSVLAEVFRLLDEIYQEDYQSLTSLSIIARGLTATGPFLDIEWVVQTDSLMYELIPVRFQWNEAGLLSEVSAPEEPLLAEETTRPLTQESFFGEHPTPVFLERLKKERTRWTNGAQAEVVEVRHSDKGANPLSTYTVHVPIGEDQTEPYTFVYDRYQKEFLEETE